MKKPSPFIISFSLGLTLILGAFALPQILSKKQNTPSPTLTTSNASQNGITINARGTNNKEKIALYINNTPVTFWNLSNNFQDYTYTPNTQVTINELSVHFLNDTWLPEQNINYDVQIPHITVNGERYNSQHNSTVSTGSWDQDSWCAPGNKQTQWLNCNGSFTYDVPQETVIGIPQKTLTVQSHVASEITSNSAKITYTASENVQAYTDYGTTTSYGQQTAKENSFTYQTHNQTLTGLQAETLYYYRINITNQAGETATKTGSFTTPEGSSGGIDPGDPGDPGPVVGWNDNQPNGGRAIGVTTAGITTSNAPLTKYKMSRRFLATRSGYVKAFKYDNRVMTSSQIKARAESVGGDWAIARDQLSADPKKSGYIMGNAYSVGNGGMQEVSLQTNGSDGRPSGTILAIARPYSPVDDLPADKKTGVDFISPGYVQAGQVYHLVWENLAPPPHRLTRLSVADARASSPNQGAIGANGVNQGFAIDQSDRLGPFHRDFGRSMIQQSASSSWKDSNILAFYSLVYSDGIEAGYMYGHFQGIGAYRYDIEGNDQARQEFTWTYPNVSVDRLVTRFGYDDDANGSPMNFIIKDQSQNTIVSGVIPFDAELAQNAKDDDYWVKHQSRHAVSILSKPVELVTGRKYYVEYSARSGAGIRMSQSTDGSLRGGSNDWNIWPNAKGTYSTDGGNSWKNFSSFGDSDWTMYLIPVGVPTKTPYP